MQVFLKFPMQSLLFLALASLSQTIALPTRNATFCGRGDWCKSGFECNFYDPFVPKESMGVCVPQGKFQDVTFSCGSGSQCLPGLLCVHGQCQSRQARGGEKCGKGLSQPTKCAVGFKWSFSCSKYESQGICLKDYAQLGENCEGDRYLYCKDGLRCVPTSPSQLWLGGICKLK